MKFNTIYVPKNNNIKEKYRNMISLYYYLLFNNKMNKYNKKLNKIYGETAELYYDFFHEHFIQKQNVLFFTLYNMLPIEFLPFPKLYMYLKYPIVSFTNNKKRPNNYSDEHIKLDSKFINKSVSNIDLYWKSFNKKIEIKKIKDINDMIKYEDSDLYDNLQFLFNIKYIKKLNSDFFKNKVLFLYVRNPIICEDFKFDLENNTLELYKYYIKETSQYNFETNKLIISLKNIRYMYVYATITRDNLLDTFNYDTLKKGTYLYSHINEKKYNMNKEKYINNRIAWYTLNPHSRILDPIYIVPNDKYVTKEFITTYDIKLLNLSTNIYLNNKIISKEKYDISNCLYNIKDNLKYCDNNFIDPNKYTDSLNYNKKQALLLIIWKNMNFVDKNMNFIDFLKYFNVQSYFNIMSLVKFKNNDVRMLGEELYLNVDMFEMKIKKLSEYTSDITKFKNYNKKYENMYFYAKSENTI